MRFELIDGDTILMGKLVNEGWELVNTFPNPYPQPYFFALMKLNTRDAASYDLGAAIEWSRKESIDRQRLSYEQPF